MRSRRWCAVPAVCRLRIVAGSLAHADAVEAVVRDADAVISMLGVRKGDTAAICTDGVGSIVRAMDAAGARRLIALSAYGASETRKASLFIRLVRKIIAAKMRDKDGMEAVVRASGLDWTLVRPAVLTNGPHTGHVRAGASLRPGLAGRISRADLAAFLLREAADGNDIGGAVVVSR